MNDSSEGFIVSDTISQYDAKIIKKRTNNLESRIMTIRESRGEKVLLFDETRFMTDSLLEKLYSSHDDMVVIKERELGDNLIVRLTNMDKLSEPITAKNLSPLRNKTVIPRFYRGNILKAAVESITNNLPEDIIRKIVALDLELLYYESYNISKNIGIIPTPEIFHYGDDDIRSLYRKYFRYGYTQRMMRGTYYANFAKPSGRLRSDSPLKYRVRSIPIVIARGIPFIMGYIMGEEAGNG